MKICITEPETLGDLAAYLRRCGCDVEIIGATAVDASPPAGVPVTPAHLRMELDGYLWVWRALNPGVGAEVLEEAPSERPVATQT